MHKRREKLPMTPDSEPNLWQMLLSLVATVWPQLYAALLAFVVALVRALHAGGRPVKSLLEALLCGCLTLALVPVLDYLGLNRDLAVAIGAGVAFLGVDWLRERAAAIAERMLGRWLGK